MTKEATETSHSGIFDCSAEHPYEYAPGRTLDELFQSNPGIFTEVFEWLNLDYPGLELVKQSVQSGEMVDAARSLVDYYRNGTHAAKLRKPAPAVSSEEDSVGERTLNGNYWDPYADVKLKTMEVLPHGVYNWAPLGLHGPFSDLLKVWLETGNPRYSKGFDRFMMDWVVYDERAEICENWEFDLGRGLRLAHTWPGIFYGIQQAEELSEVARFLMLRSAYRQTHSAYENPGHSVYANIMASIYVGNLSTGTYFPEFKASPLWANSAVEEITKLYRNGVFSDGMETEMATRYACNFAAECENFIGMAGQSGFELGNDFRAFIENQWNIHFYLMQPNGDAANFGDSYVFKLEEYFTADNNKRWNDFPREDWKYIASNGREGTRPEGLPSRVFPVSGQVVTRTGWGDDALWGLFDAGPKGVSGHGHQDKLNLQVANGRPILVDSGKPVYFGEGTVPYLHYFRGSAGHNVLLFDGIGQALFNTDEPANLIEGRDYTVTEERVYARGTVNRFAEIKFTPTSSLIPTPELEGVTHTRELIYFNDKYWIVIDHVVPETFKTVQAPWHFAADCTLEAEGMSVSTVDPEVGNLTIVPLGDADWKVELVKGQTEPVQGWHRSDRGPWETHLGGVQIPVAVYEAPSGPKTFAWLLYPWTGEKPDIEIASCDLSGEGFSLKMTVNGGEESVEFSPSAEEITPPLQLSNGQNTNNE